MAAPPLFLHWKDRSVLTSCKAMGAARTSAHRAHDLDEVSDVAIPQSLLLRRRGDPVMAWRASIDALAGWRAASQFFEGGVDFRCPDSS
jgi:hypothetical protein